MSAGAAGGDGADTQLSGRELWSAVDELVTDLLVGHDAALEQALRTSAQAGLPPIAVSPPQGKFLHLLTRIHRAQRVLELGTLGGYSTIWLARAVAPEGQVVTLELDPDYARVAAANLERAGVAALVELIVGPAADSLERLVAERREPFDLVFIDADKRSTPEYFERALELVRPGGLIVVDNVVRDGGVADPDHPDPHVQGMRRFHELAAVETRVTATTVQTVGLKGYDGFTLALVSG
jgi:predicted O-methyltransferase YrrM